MAVLHGICTVIVFVFWLYNNVSVLINNRRKYCKYKIELKSCHSDVEVKYPVSADV